MPYFSLAAVVAGADDDAQVIDLTCALAARQGALAKVVSATPVEMPMLAPVGLGAGGLLSAEAWKAVDEHRRDVLSRTLRLVETATAAHGLTRAAAGAPAVRMAVSAATPWQALQRELPLADLVLMAASSARADGPWTGLMADVLMGARAPLLLTRGDAPVCGGHVAIAWDGSLEAGRAVRAAAPLLQEAAKVTILQRPGDLDAGKDGAADPERLGEYLRAAGARDVSIKLIKGEPVGPAILETVASIGAGVLVSGAFGHARLREAVLGGATRAFLQAREGPHLFLCH